MIRINIKHIFVLAGFIGSFLSCQDLKFGDDFLEKAPSNDVDIDVIYSNAQYARTALWSAYATLHYGLNLGNQGNQLMGSDPLDCLTDLVYSNVWTDGVSGAAIHYNGTYSADYENNGYSSNRFTIKSSVSCTVPLSFCISSFAVYAWSTIGTPP